MTADQLPIKIRRAVIEDLIAIQNLFVETILCVCGKDYSPEQLQVWTSGIRNRERWLDKLKTQLFLVAEQDNHLVGFASLANGDYIDLLYVHQYYQRQGIAYRLLAALEKEAMEQGVLVLKSDVSKTARPFFEKNGFRVIKAQTKTIDAVEISNFSMEKVQAPKTKVL